MLGPGVNIYRAPMCGRNFEYFGEDPFLSARTAVAYIKGMQSQGVSATIKHFMGNNQEYDRHNIDSVSYTHLRRILWILLVSLALAVSSSVYLYGQSTYGSISGSVNDTTGAVVTDANVTLTNLGTGEKRTQSSGSDGLFTFVNLFAGQYRIDVQKQGFKRFARLDITVQVQQDTHIAAALQVGEVSQIVEVTAETPLLQSETSSLGQVVEGRQADELPLNGRNIFNLITASPAAVAQGGSGGTPVSQNPFSWGNYQVGGSFGNQSAEYLDGQPLNIGYINLPFLVPTQDSISCLLYTSRCV